LPHLNSPLILTNFCVFLSIVTLFLRLDLMPQDSNLIFCATVPSRPLNLTINHISSRTVGLSWMAPEMRNGRLLGYRLYYLHNNFTETISFIAITTPVTTYNLTGLSKQTLCQKKTSVTKIKIASCRSKRRLQDLGEGVHVQKRG
jgi:Fibronectin type III domain